MVSLFLYHGWQTYTNQMRHIDDDSTKQNKMIELAITELFSYTNYLNTYMGKQIAEHGAGDLNFIYNTFQKASGTQYKAQEMLSWSMFDWVSADNLQIVNSKNGIVINPPDMSMREYTWKSPQNPWSLQVSKPAFGIPSGNWIIPAGTGVVDNNNKYLGTIAVGLNIAELTRRIEALVNSSKISFLVLDNNMNIILQSQDNEINPASSYYKEVFAKSGYLHKKEEAISLEDKNGHIKYTQSNKIEGYPYIILTGFNKQLVSKEFETILLPRIIEFLGIVIFFITMLYFFRKRIVTPVTELSQAADRIAQGEFIKKLPRSKSIETTGLAKQLVRVMRYMMKEKRQMEEIEKARHKENELHKIIRDSDDEREIFLRELYHAMNNPLNVVLSVSEMLQKRILGNNIDKYNEVLEIMYIAGRQLESFTTDILHPVEVNIKQLINRCVRLQKKKANETRLKIEVNVADDIPLILADELRLRQILISILGQSLLCIQDFGTIKISAFVHTKKGGKPGKLIISIEDNGLGISEGERCEHWERAFGETDKNSYSRNPDITRLSFPIIRHLVELHQGSFKLEAVSNIGSTFTIGLPYLSKKEFDISQKDVTRVATKIVNSNAIVKNKPIDKIGSGNDNVIKFPRKE